MGFTYFVIGVIAVLLGYYIWAIKQEASPKSNFLSEKSEEEVEYEFSTPIRVSEEYITGRKTDVKEQQGNEVEAQQTSNAPREEARRVSLPQEEVGFTNFIDLSKAKQYGNALASLVEDVLSPSVSSNSSSEVEFYHLTNLRDHMIAGRQMFSDIQIA
jgi:hypothetical protein